MFVYGRWLWLTWRVLRHWLPRYLASWLLLLTVGGLSIQQTLTTFDDARRDDGNYGHATIDFAGQWFTGKMLLRGEGKFLFERNHQYIVFQTYFPPDANPFTGIRSDRFRLEDWNARPASDPEATPLLASYLMPMGATSGVGAAAALAGGYQAAEPNRKKFGNPWQQTDADKLMSWLLGNYDQKAANTFGSCALPLGARDQLGAAALLAAGQQRVWTAEAIQHAGKRQLGGNFYPPIHAFWYIPLGMLDPPTSYRVTLAGLVAIAVLTGLGLSKISGGWLWWPIASVFVIVFPGFIEAQALGHSTVLLLLFFVWGWYCFQNNHEIAGGIWWGLLAYKPTWAIVYFAALLATRRWKAALAMGLCGIAQILLTLPLVGVHSWLEWQQVSRNGAAYYNKSDDWIRCARDFHSLVRRIMFDFEIPNRERTNHFEATVVTAICYGVALEATIRLATLRLRRGWRWSPAAGAFILFGFWMCCYRITFYDTLLCALPAALLLLTPGPIQRPYFWRRSRLEWSTGQATLTLPLGNFGWVFSPLIVVTLPLMVWCPIWYNWPWVVLFFVVTWVWAGWLWLREPWFLSQEEKSRESALAPAVGGLELVAANDSGPLARTPAAAACRSP